MLYVGATLPCARFYYEGDEGFFGNSLLRISYQMLYAYLTVIMHWLDKAERETVSVLSPTPGPTKPRKPKRESKNQKLLHRDIMREVSAYRREQRAKLQAQAEDEKRQRAARIAAFVKRGKSVTKTFYMFR
jgi:hypothetical protein